MGVVVFGSANADLVVGVGDFPAPGETVFGTSFAVALGGKGVNQAVAAARLGAATAFVGRVGGDPYGAMLRDGLAAVGVDVTGVAVDPALATGVAVVVIDADGQNRIVVVSGANWAVGDADVARLAQELRAGDVLLLQLELRMAAVVAAADLARTRGARVILDPAPAPGDGLPAGLYAPHVVLTPNETEAAALVGHDLATREAAERAARTLSGRGAGGVVIKLGERGICWALGDTLRWQPASVVDVVDTVGAGDAVNGALAAVLAEGGDLAQAVRWSAVAGSLAVTRAGAADAMPTREHVMGVLSRWPR